MVPIGASAVIVSMHGKETIIGPILSEGLRMTTIRAEGVDTDRFGTFSGEVARQGSQRSTAIKKAMAGFTRSKATWAIASEGTMRPHPQRPEQAIGDELVILVNRSETHIFEGWDRAAETNFISHEVRSADQAVAAARRLGFPSHGIVIRQGVEPFAETVAKGIIDEHTLRRSVIAALASWPSALVQPDLRAHLNPTRQQAIARATRALVAAVLATMA